MNVLIACEESQTVCKAFRALGHRAFSADIQECSGSFPEWHIMGDCLPLLNGNCKFTTQDGRRHRQKGEWQLLVAHPPCTYMSNAGARWMFPAGQLSQERLKLAMKAKEFFFKMYDAKCKYIAIENPRPLAIVGLPKPTTIIQPYEFGEPYSKVTYLWLKNLPPLMPTLVMAKYKPFVPSNTGGGRKKGQKWYKGIASSAKERSKTFSGVAQAMAMQWSNFINENEKTSVTLRAAGERHSCHPVT